MKILFSRLILAALVLSSAAAAGAVQAPEDELIIKARAFLTALEKNDFQAAARR